MTKVSGFRYPYNGGFSRSAFTARPDIAKTERWKVGRISMLVRLSSALWTVLVGERR